MTADDVEAMACAAIDALTVEVAASYRQACTASGVDALETAFRIDAYLRDVIAAQSDWCTALRQRLTDAE